MATDKYLSSLFANKHFPATPKQQQQPELLKVLKVPQDANEAAIVLRHLSFIIKSLTNNADNVTNVNNPTNAVNTDNALISDNAFNASIAISANNSANVVVDQLPLNLVYGAYCHLLYKYNLLDNDFGNLIKVELSANNEISFQKLFALLQTAQWQQILETQLQQLLTECVKALHVALQENQNSVLIIIKCLNLLYKKLPTSMKENEFGNIKLSTFYHCLQHGQEFMREETLLLFSYYCCKSSAIAFEYFKVILYCWPWTNRNKLYLLTCIVNAHNLTKFLNDANHSAKDFFAGLRLSLSYKKLLAPSQHLIKAISSQKSYELLELSVEILTCGTQFELKNFYAQWFSRINKQQQEHLFELLQQRTETVQFLADINSSSSSSSCRTNAADEHFRLIIIFNMFSGQIFNVSKLYFFKISTELITNCFQFEIESQLLIFRFIAENFVHFAIEDCIEFILNFIKVHKSIESAQFRHCVLGKVPFIINYIAKTFNKLKNTIEATTLEKSIVAFFVQLHQMIDEDIANDIYQPKIFSLRLLEILCNSLYVGSMTKNTKSCVLAHNQKLGNFLIKHKVVDLVQLKNRLIQLLNDTMEIYDDAMVIITNLLQNLHYTDTEKAIALCQNACVNCNIDVCALTDYLARVSMQSLQTNLKSSNKSNYADVAFKFFQKTYTDFEMLIERYQADPLLCCQTKRQLFGYLYTMDEILLEQPTLLDMDYVERLLDTLKIVIEMVLEFLNLAKAENNSNKQQQSVVASSFQDMDESLELLVQRSAGYETDKSTTVCRQMLLMSFWLTLKGCCNLATTIGCNLVVSSVADQQVDLKLLENCLHINVQVLTRCRHKGAIESAGLSIGKLTRSITSQFPIDSSAYNLLYNCLKILFIDNMQVSTTRRGAGFSIMLLHIVKNEQNHRPRVILQKVLHDIFASLSTNRSVQISPIDNDAPINFDRLEALTLHYLCVLVKDTELRLDISKYYNEIMMTAILHIDHSEWTICNAALQLFGSLVPKILGQKQAIELNDDDNTKDNIHAIIDWESTEIIYTEVQHKLPKMCEYILNYIGDAKAASTRSIILFLSFLVKVEHLRMNFIDQMATNEHETEEDIVICVRIKNLMFHLLRHSCEKVRKLAAVCFVRAHDLYLELPFVLLKIAKLLFTVQNENLFHGLCCTLIQGVHKMTHDCRHIMNVIGSVDMFLYELRLNLKIHCKSFTYASKFKVFTLCKLLDLMILIDFEAPMNFYKQLIDYNIKSDCLGNGDNWYPKLKKLKCSK